MSANTSERALGERIRELRRRHFGPQGKDAFARRLGLTVEEYTRYEHGLLPPGEVMVRMCEITGEDLQWLLTGVAGRGTVVIAGTRGRHQDLLARLARLLDERPESAAPVEAFLDLLVRSTVTRAEAPPVLAPPARSHLIPMFEPEQSPQTLATAVFELVRLEDAPRTVETERYVITEPAMNYAREHLRPVDVLTLEAPGGDRQRFVSDESIARLFPQAFGVGLADDSMRPMFDVGNALVVAADVGAKVGRPALCLVQGDAKPRCRIWLGSDAEGVHLGRLSDGECEDIPPAQVLWSLEVLFRLARAA